MRPPIVAEIMTKNLVRENSFRNTLEKVLLISNLDMLEIPAFKKDKKISQFFQPLKELSERFPKEKFIDNIIDYEKAITDVKKDYIKHLKEKDKVSLSFKIE